MTIDNERYEQWLRDILASYSDRLAYTTEQLRITQTLLVEARADIQKYRDWIKSFCKQGRN